MMRRYSALVPMCLALTLIAAGCKKSEPIPPTTPPTPESQLSASPSPSAADAGAISAPEGSAQAGATPAAIPTSSAETPPNTTEPATGAMNTSALQTTPATSAAAAKAAPDAASGAVDGAKIFQTYCQACHGETGAGDGPAATTLNPKPASFATRSFKYDANGDGTRGELDDIVAVIRDGAAKYGGSQMMAPWPTLTKEQQDAVARHVKSLGSGGG